MMTAVSGKLSQAKESVKNIYKKVFMDLLYVKPFDVEIVFWCNPLQDDKFFHFRQVANIIDNRLIECKVGGSGEFIAIYVVRAEDRDMATREAQKICDLIRKDLGSGFKFKYYQVK